LEEKYPINNANSADDIKFPLENSENSYLIMENNLEFTENLSNLVFLEFELVSSSHDLKHFKEINNDFVEKEINFVLNVIINPIINLLIIIGLYSWSPDVQKRLEILNRNKENH